jgi:tetratricopeptide (TPR) repeat protein
MWYLVVPPIIFIGSLALLFWFFSKKSVDPAIEEMIDRGAGEDRPRRFLFIKEETGLRVLEKLTQRLKLLSLKVHNRFNQFAELLRRRRQSVSGEETPVVSAPAEAVSREEGGFWDRWQRRHTRSTAASAVTEEKETPPEERPSFVHIAAEKTAPAREAARSWGDSVVATGNEAVKVFRRRRLASGGQKRLSEEELIDRIARNPKDAPAYEELGDFYMETGNLSDAKACYRQVIKLLPLNREVKEKVRRLERLLVQKEKGRG